MFRGSRRRLRRIRFRDNWSREMWIVIVVIVLTLLFVVPKLIRHQRSESSLGEAVGKRYHAGGAR